MQISPVDNCQKRAPVTLDRRRDSFYFVDNM
jgi:hypothetical protein